MLFEVCYRCVEFFQFGYLIWHCNYLVYQWSIDKWMCCLVFVVFIFHRITGDGLKVERLATDDAGGGVVVKTEKFWLLLAEEQQTFLAGGASSVHAAVV